MQSSKLWISDGRLNRKTPVVLRKFQFMVIYFIADCSYEGKEVRSRSDHDRAIKLSWAHTVTLILHAYINFRVTESVFVRRSSY